MSRAQLAEGNTEERVAAIIAKLRERGHRLTPQRLAIIRNFVGRLDHPSAEAIYRQLHADFPMMAISTVYNTLNTLVELGEAIEVASAAPEARFDPNTGDHIHLVCLSCGSIVDLPLEQTPELPADLRGSTGFRPIVHVHQVLGSCADCQSAGEGTA